MATFFPNVKNFINFRVTRNNTVCAQTRTREWKEGIISLLLLLLFSQTLSGNFFFLFLSFKRGFPPQIREYLENKASTRQSVSLPEGARFSLFDLSFCPTNDILSTISIFSNYNLQRRKVFFNEFFFSFSFFLYPIFSITTRFISVPEKREKFLFFLSIFGRRGGVDRSERGKGY